MPRKEESLCSLVKSTLRLVVFSGMFTLVPLDEVRVMVFTSTTKARRLVFGGGDSGVAIMVTLTVAVPVPPPVPPPEFLGKPLHETRKAAHSHNGATTIFRTFMQPPRQEWVPSPRRAKAPTMTLSLACKEWMQKHVALFNC